MKIYTITAWEKDIYRTNGATWGPFRSRQEAERCLSTLASRQDVKSAKIYEEDVKDDEE